VPRALWWSDAGAAAQACCCGRASELQLSVPPMLDAHRCHSGRCAHHPAVHRTQAGVASHNLSTLEAKEQNTKTSDFSDMSYVHRMTHEHVAQARSLTQPGGQQVRQRPLSSNFTCQHVVTATCLARHATPHLAAPCCAGAARFVQDTASSQCSPGPPGRLCLHDVCVCVCWVV
jgi:hypothetical protein